MKNARKRATRRPASPDSPTWEVIVVDGQPLRKKAEREYQKAVRDLDAAKAESERFQSEDKPLFAKWMAAHFGATLTEIRDLQSKLFEAQQLVNEVQQEYHFGGHNSILSAYRQVMHRRAHPEKVEDEQTAENEIDAEEAEAFRREAEEVFGKAAEEFWRRLEENTLGRNSPLPKEKTAGKKIKELYRALARRLHPDKGHALTDKQKELWHQTQAAYQNGNIEELEVILTLLEVDDKGTKDAAISTLHQLTSAFKKSLRALKRQLTEFRRDAAWNFSRGADRTALKRETEITLTMDREKTLWLLRKYEAQIQQWQNQPEPRSKGGGRKRRANLMDEPWF